MKKTFTIIILNYFLFTLNINRALTQEAASQEENILKVGVLVPLKGAQKKIGKVVLNSVKLALQDIDSKNLKIYPVDIGNTLEKKNAALTHLKNAGVKIVIGPILYQDLENLKESNLFFLKRKKILEIFNSYEVIESFFIFKNYQYHLDIKIK